VRGAGNICIRQRCELMASIVRKLAAKRVDSGEEVSLLPEIYEQQCSLWKLVFAVYVE
jgi:hypothetical protein